MHNPQYDGSHHKNVPYPRDAVSELVSRLDIVVVNPSFIYDRDTIKSGCGYLGEEGSENVPEYISNTVRCPDIKGVIITKGVLELGCKVAAGTSHDTKQHSGS